MRNFIKSAIRALAVGTVMIGSAAMGQDVSLTGSGSTFIRPLMQKWAAEYSKMHPNVTINYQGIGSGGGIKQISDKTVDFGATDGPMTEEQMSKAPGILHLPMTMGAVVPIYNLPSVKQPLVFDGPTLAGIYMGQITMWNDAKISALNPGVTLPERPISVVHRSDGSGTTYIWTDYLSKVSSDWKSGPGTSTTVKWPAGRGGKGNDGVAGEVKQNEGSIGYVELIYAANNNIDYGDMKNSAGKTVHATTASVSAAAATLSSVPDDLRVSITDAPGDASYPISGFSWVLAYREQTDATKAKALVDFLWWATHDGQPMSDPMHYAPLPAAFIPLVEKKLESITADGKPLLAEHGS